MNNPTTTSTTLPSLDTSRNVDKVTAPNVKVKTTATLASSATRGALSNITNVSKLSDNLPVKKSEKSAKMKNSSIPTSKRSSGQLENEPKALKNKKRKSDPMIIDEEEPSVVSSHVSYEDIDQNDYDDPQAVVEYVNDIYHYLMIKEKDRVNPQYINTQVDINEKMRSILVDWLVEVHRMFKLLPETLFMSVSIIDRFLSMKQITRDMLQLVGITSMLIASKYEEIYAPECNDFVYISDGAYTKQQILQMEQTILNTLNFNITHPSALHFLRRYSKAAGSDYTLHTICKYLIELVMIDIKFLRYPTSLMAAASVYLGRAMISRAPLWTPTLEHYTTYSELMVRECALELNDLLKRSQNSGLKAIRKKYSLPKYGQVAELPLVDL